MWEQIGQTADGRSQEMRCENCVELHSDRRIGILIVNLYHYVLTNILLISERICHNHIYIIISTCESPFMWTYDYVTLLS